MFKIITNVIPLILVYLCLIDAQPGTGTLSCTEGDTRIIRTTSFDNDYSGRVEVCYTGVWGTIATSGAALWSEKNAQVACRAADFDGAINSVFTNGLGFGDRASDTTPVHFSAVECTGSETTLSNCTLNTDTSSFMSSPTTYRHISDVFVVCRPKTEGYSIVHAPGTQLGDFRLSGDSRNGRGAVEIFTRQFRWVSMCPDGFSDADASALCRRLGYAGGTTSLYTVPEGSVGPQYLYDTDCTETGANVGLTTGRIVAGVCSFLFSLNGCPSGAAQYAGVVCSESSVSLGAVRLFGGGDSEGILETYYDGRWGMVCSGDSFDEEEARVVCDELGYHPPKSAYVAPDTSLLEMESNLKPIWLSGVQCSEGVNRLVDCGSDQVIGYGPCNVGSIVAVRCEPLLTGGEIAGIVIGIPIGLIILLVIAWFAGLNKHWENRRRNKHYQALLACCTACKQRSNVVRQRIRERPRPEQQQRAETQETTVTMLSTPSVPPAPFPEPAAEPVKRELTESDPPQYPPPIGFQGFADQPPPYVEVVSSHPQ